MSPELAEQETLKLGLGQKLYESKCLVMSVNYALGLACFILKTRVRFYETSLLGAVLKVARENMRRRLSGHQQCRTDRHAQKQQENYPKGKGKYQDSEI